MAQKVVVSLVDDLDGEFDADETVAFGLDGVTYEIDLSDIHASEFRTVLDRYVRAARRTGGRYRRTGRLDTTPSAATQAVVPTPAKSAPAKGRTVPARASREQNQAIREWAIKQGFTVAPRGRIPADVSNAFHKYEGKAIPKDETPTDRAELTLDLAEGDDVTTGDAPVVPLTNVVSDDESDDDQLEDVEFEDDGDELDPVGDAADVAREVEGEDAAPPADIAEWGDTPALLSKDQKKTIATWAHGQGMIDSASMSRVTRDLVGQYKAIKVRELANA